MVSSARKLNGITGFSFKRHPDSRVSCACHDGSSDNECSLFDLRVPMCLERHLLFVILVLGRSQAGSLD